MTAADTYDRLPDAVADIFGEDATAAYAYDLLTVDVPASSWIAALETARDELGCGYFDWLSAVDEPGTGFLVCAHVAAPGSGRVRRLLVRTTVPREAPALPTAIDVYAGAAWHERETHEMFGVRFEDHPHLVPLLLPEGFEGHPLRKDFVLAARVAKAWPGAKEPGESEHGGPKRRTMLPPGVPDPNEWGPLKGQLPPAPARPARGARAAGDRPVRRARTASEGSAEQRPAAPDAAAGATAPDAAATPQAAPPRRSRSVSQGSASQSAEPAAPTTEPSRPATGLSRPAATEGEAASPSDAAQAPAPEATEADAAPAPADAAPAPADAGPAGTEPTSTPAPRAPRAPRAVRSTDAPWHHARPAFDDASSGGAPDSPEPAGPAPEAAPDRATAAGTIGAGATEPEAGVTEPEAEAAEAAEAAEPEPSPEAEPEPDPDPRTDRPAGGDTA
ncbi:NADH-quinone oxidoreductase subunit C [Streptomyces sp. NBC_00887]|uniref:NADH-quinone oxidoreductase subunit C n=1 Tax=Streptomyces sp. NBC_00887 TaxID=2975859 RepID=UPI0038706877|nr:NADH-quinone oxidoreductase subunit C [Streptomyces sp. NBC_00887]